MAKKVLIVDDSATMRQQLRLLLESDGFEVAEAEDGLKGFATARAGNFDLLIVDVNMPRMNGLTAVAAIRKIPHYAKTPIFILTTESTSGVIEQGKRAGATAWIVKPYESKSLLEGINKVLGQ